MSKIAVASNNGGLDDQVSKVFGRCPTFTIVEFEGNVIKDSKVVDNQHAEDRGGAGIQTSGFIANQGVEVVIAGNFGPNVTSVFNESDIKMAPASGMTVREAVEKYLEGSLDTVSQPTAAAKSGGGMGQRSGGKTRSKQSQPPKSESPDRSVNSQKSGNTEKSVEDIENLLDSVESQIKEIRSYLKKLK